jgi:hypothetical protein
MVEESEPIYCAYHKPFQPMVCLSRLRNSVYDRITRRDFRRFKSYTLKVISFSAFAAFFSSSTFILALIS